MSVQDLLSCGHAANVSPGGTPAIGFNPATGGTVCDTCARALPPQPMTIDFLGNGGEEPYTSTGLDTDSIPVPPGYTSRGHYFMAKDGTPTSVRWMMLDGSVKYIHVSNDVFGLYRFEGEWSGE